VSGGKVVEYNVQKKAVGRQLVGEGDEVRQSADCVRRRGC
jgi:hypothetical protein